MESLNSKYAGLTQIVTTTTMPVVNVHCLRTCHVMYTVTTRMCLTRAERLTSAVRVSRCPNGHSAGVCGPKVHGMISGLEGLITGIKGDEGRLNR